MKSKVAPLVRGNLILQMAQMYFIALVAPQEINEQILSWKRLMKERFDCVVALRSPAHITLIPPFWMDTLFEENLFDTLSAFAGKRAPFEIELKDFGAFKPRVIFVDVIKNKALELLQTQLEHYLVGMKSFPIQPDAHPFHPHVTIATRDLHKKSFSAAWEIFREKKFDALWKCSGISLLSHSQKNWDVVTTSQFE